MSPILIFVIAIAVLALGLFAAGLYFYRTAISRADKSFLKGDPDLQPVTGTMKKEAEIAKPWWEEQAVEEWKMQSHDGLRLTAYYLNSPGVRLEGEGRNDNSQPSVKAVILAHGYSGYAGQMGELGRFYHERGYHVLIPDARGHGKSEGKYIGFGWHERLDYVGWIRELIEQLGPEVQIVLHGVSMGGATVMMTSGEKLPSQVKAIVEDCGYTSVKDELTYQMKRMYRLPAFPLVPITSLVAKIKAGYFFGEASALKQVQRAQVPMLFIHGGADKFVPTDMVYELYEKGPKEKQLHIVPDAGHGMARQTDPESYDGTVEQFLQRYVQ